MTQRRIASILVFRQAGGGGGGGGGWACGISADIPLFVLEPGVSLKDAWTLMRAEQIKVLPVVDTQRFVLGIVTVADFMRLANLDLHERLGQRWRTLVMGRSGQQPSTVGEIMSHSRANSPCGAACDGFGPVVFVRGAPPHTDRGP